MDAEQALALRFLERHAAQAAALLERDPASAAAFLEDGCPEQVGRELLRRMTPGAGAACLARLEPECAAAFVRELPLDLLGVVLRGLDAERAEPLIEALPDLVRIGVRRLLRHAPDTAGAVMDPTVLALASDLGVEEARTRLREDPGRSTYYLYVVDRDAKLVGVLTMRDLMLARPERGLAEIMVTGISVLRATAHKREILASPAWRAHPMLPVVDEAGHFLGVIRYETLRALEREHVARMDPVAAPAIELAELVWLGLSQIVDGLGGIPERATRPENDGGG